MTDLPEVLFVCTHNAGRSQMAAALLDHEAAGRVRVTSAGSQPARQLNPAVVQAMAEIGLDLSREYPKPLTTGQVRAADVVITMGCGDACPSTPASVTWTGTCLTPPGCRSRKFGRSAMRSAGTSVSSPPTWHRVPAPPAERSRRTARLVWPGQRPWPLARPARGGGGPGSAVRPSAPAPYSRRPTRSSCSSQSCGGRCRWKERKNSGMCSASSFQASLSTVSSRPRSAQLMSRPSRSSEPGAGR